MSLTVRRAVPGDEDIVCSLRLQAVVDAPDAFETTLARERARTGEDWKTWIEERATFLLEADGIPRGLVAGVPHRDDPTAAYLIAMWVHSDVRGRGGGDALVASILAWARREGLRWVYLDVGRHNRRARALYERQGFLATGRVWHQERNGIEEVEMKIRIDGSTT